MRLRSVFAPPGSAATRRYRAVRCAASRRRADASSSQPSAAALDEGRSFPGGVFASVSAAVSRNDASRTTRVVASSSRSESTRTPTKSRTTFARNTALGGFFSTRKRFRFSSPSRRIRGVEPPARRRSPGANPRGLYRKYSPFSTSTVASTRGGGIAIDRGRSIGKGAGPGIGPKPSNPSAASNDAPWSPSSGPPRRRRPPNGSLASNTSASVTPRRRTLGRGASGGSAAARLEHSSATSRSPVSESAQKHARAVVSNPRRVFKRRRGGPGSSPAPSSRRSVAAHWTSHASSARSATAAVRASNTPSNAACEVSSATPPAPPGWRTTAGAGAADAAPAGASSE